MRTDLAALPWKICHLGSDYDAMANRAILSTVVNLEDDDDDDIKLPSKSGDALAPQPPGTISDSRSPSYVSDLEQDDTDDEFKPLFDYTETVPSPTYFSDDDEDDFKFSSAPKRRCVRAQAKEPSTPSPQEEIVTVGDDDDDESWLLPSPPKSSPLKFPNRATSALLSANYALHQLRQSQTELMGLQFAASPEGIKRVEEQAKLQLQHRPDPESPLAANTSKDLNFHEEILESKSVTPEKREKVLLKVQNKTGSYQSIRIFMTDKFEKLFSVYAEMVDAPLANLSFCFDGDQLSSCGTPKEHDMEDGDVIEVYSKI